MKKATRTTRKKATHTMRAEYDFSKGVRGKYADRFLAQSNVVVLDPDVIEVFPTSSAVNDALRALAKIIRSAPRGTRRRRKSA